MKDHDLLTAHFVNNERTVVQAFWITPDGKETREEYIEAKEGDDHWENLLKHINIELLHENTYKHIREQNVLFEDQVISIARERQLIYDIDSANTEVYKIMSSLLFAPFDPEKDKEKLFMYKLQLFEVDQIRDSKNKELKANLRKSKNILEATKVAIEIVAGS